MDPRHKLRGGQTEVFPLTVIGHIHQFTWHCLKEEIQVFTNDETRHLVSCSRCMVDPRVKLLERALDSFKIAKAWSPTAFPALRSRLLRRMGTRAHPTFLNSPPNPLLDQNTPTQSYPERGVHARSLAQRLEAVPSAHRPLAALSSWQATWGTMWGPCRLTCRSVCGPCVTRSARGVGKRLRPAPGQEESKEEHPGTQEPCVWRRPRSCTGERVGDEQVP